MGNSQISYCRSEQATRRSQRGQSVERLFFEWGQTNHEFLNFLHVGVPATPANVGFLKIPLQVRGRVLSFGLSPVLNTAGANADGTVLLRVMPYTPAGGGAWATVCTITLGATAAGYMEVGGVEVRSDAITLAGGVAPYPLVGGEMFLAYCSGLRTGVGAVGMALPWIEVVYDTVFGPPSAAQNALVDMA
jgi:hypothetical protein